jgi:3' exoribonuclease, RNase T-like
VTVIAYDCEFLEDGKAIDLISIGMVREDGAEYYAVNSDANWAKIAERRWLCENVVPHLPLASKGVRKATPGENTNVTTAWKFSIDLTDTRVRPCWVIANEVREFILAAGGEPELWADSAAHQFVVLCQLWGAVARRPAGVPSWTHDLRQEIERAGNPPIPPLEGVTSHNALSDAREVAWRLLWLREHAAT